MINTRMAGIVHTYRMAAVSFSTRILPDATFYGSNKLKFIIFMFYNLTTLLNKSKGVKKKLFRYLLGMTNTQANISWHSAHIQNGRGVVFDTALTWCDFYGSNKLKFNIFMLFLFFWSSNIYICNKNTEKICSVYIYARILMVSFSTPWPLKEKPFV